MQLIVPEKRYIKSYYDLCCEYFEDGEDTDGLHDPRMAALWQRSIFKQYELYRLGIGVISPTDIYWLEDDGAVIGIGSLRHELFPEAERMGGHIGYRVRKSMQGRGYGTMQLRLLMDKAYEIDIKKALITCSDTNMASIRVIEKNGGVLQDVIENTVDGKPRPTRRYWVDTTPKGVQA